MPFDKGFIAALFGKIMGDVTEAPSWADDVIQEAERIQKPRVNKYQVGQPLVVWTTDDHVMPRSISWSDTHKTFIYRCIFGNAPYNPFETIEDGTVNLVEEDLVPYVTSKPTLKVVN